jgi:hypothetical protein
MPTRRKKDGEYMEEDKLKRDMKNKKIRAVKIVLLVALVLLIIGVPVFFTFRIKTEGRLALREAKNVKLALEMISVEYYGMGLSIYDSTNASGLTDGVRSRLDEIIGEDYDISVTSYDKNSRNITSFDYINDNYMVRYICDTEKGDAWKVYYKYLVFDYDGN